MNVLVIGRLLLQSLQQPTHAWLEGRLNIDVNEIVILPPEGRAPLTDWISPGRSACQELC